eukprot:scaffold55648_cov76-Phaeocystis_antarctica.AAC.2
MIVSTAVRAPIDCTLASEEGVPADLSALIASEWPLAVAISSGVTPCTACASSDAPAASSARMASAWPVVAATCSGVHPASIVLDWPPAAAKCNGVTPRSPRALSDAPAITSTDAPAATNALTAFEWPPLAAKCRAVLLPSARASSDAPASASTSIASAWPARAALCRGVSPSSILLSRHPSSQSTSNTLIPSTSPRLAAECSPVTLLRACTSSALHSAAFAWLVWTSLLEASDIAASSRRPPAPPITRAARARPVSSIARARPVTGATREDWSREQLEQTACDGAGDKERNEPRSEFRLDTPCILLESSAAVRCTRGGLATRAHPCAMCLSVEPAMLRSKQYGQQQRLPCSFTQCQRRAWQAHPSL